MGVWPMAMNARGLNGLGAAVYGVLQHGPRQPLVIGEPFLDLTKGFDLDLRVVHGSLVHDVGCLEHVSTVNQGDFTRKSSEERRLFARRVATADDQHVLVSEEGTVARRTRGDTTALLFFFTGRTQPHGFSAGADNDGMRQ